MVVNERRKSSLLVLSFINLYFPVSFFIREFLEFYYGFEFFSLIESDIEFYDWIIVFFVLMVFLYFYNMKVTFSQFRLFEKQSSKFLLVISVVLYLSVLFYFKILSLNYSYEGFHKFISSSYIGKIQYLMYFCLAVQIYYCSKFDNLFLVKILFFQLFISVFISEMRSFILFQIVCIFIIPSVSRIVFKHKIKFLFIVFFVLLVPLFFRSKTVDFIFIFSQVFLAGAFQYDFISVSLNGFTLNVPESYVSSGGGFGSFMPAYLYEYIGFFAIVFWVFLPFFLMRVNTVFLMTISIYFFTIVRNNPSSWGNGLIFLIFVLLLLKVVPKYEEKNYK